MKKIKCIRRIYSITFQNGVMVEIESRKPLSKELNDMLLKEDTNINSFFDNYNIITVKNAAVDRTVSEHTSDKKHLSPQQRHDVLLQMQGEFTRVDYQKHIKSMGYDVSDNMVYSDIEAAIKLGDLEDLGREKNTRLRKYRVRIKEQLGSTDEQPDSTDEQLGSTDEQLGSTDEQR